LQSSDRGGNTLFKLFRRKSKDEQQEAEERAAPESAAVATLPPVESVIAPVEWQDQQEEDLSELDEEAFAEVATEQTGVGIERTRRTWFSRISGVFERSQIDDDLWDELEELLIGADIGMDTTTEIIDYCKDVVRKDSIKQPEDAREVLKDDLEDILLSVDQKGSLWGSESTGVASPAVILVIGVNGVGKTTSIAKLAALFKRDGERVVLAAADTFRAAAIDQLKMWGDRIGVEVIAGKPGSDPGAVVYDAMEAARARNADVVIVDTAGRLHTKHNLMQELSKIRKVLQGRDATAPHEVLLVVDSTTGQNGLMQAKAFADAVDVSAIFLSKLDGTAKGGIVFPICAQLGIPVRFIGTGERATDIAPFDPTRFVESLFAS
jgi:fused signal recognition particle receptor